MNENQNLTLSKLKLIYNDIEYIKDNYFRVTGELIYLTGEGSFKKFQLYNNDDIVVVDGKHSLLLIKSYKDKGVDYGKITGIVKYVKSIDKITYLGYGIKGAHIFAIKPEIGLLITEEVRIKSSWSNITEHYYNIINFREDNFAVNSLRSLFKDELERIKKETNDMYLDINMELESGNFIISAKSVSQYIEIIQLNGEELLELAEKK